MSGCSKWFERTPGQSLEVRKITPPKLETAYLGQQILCYRPMRRGSPNMSVGVAGEKLIAYNNGHGGSGWTLGPGCATYVVDLFAASEKGKGVAKNAPITVIGGGVLGLFAASDPIQRGYSDANVVPVQGHIVMLKDQVPENLQYVILVFFDHAKTVSNQDVKPSFYIFPKHLQGAPVNDVGVIGGTFIENATPDTPNIEEFQIMINNAKKFYSV